MTSTTDESNFFKTAELSRVMIPADANVAGNVHGGTIMQMLEESAGVAASRFFNHYTQDAAGHIKVLTARVESITFQQPLHVGDIAKVQAQVVFSSKHTVAVSVKLISERLTAKKDAVGNRALLWIVGHVDNDSSTHDMAKDKNGIATVQRNAHSSHSGSLVEAPPLDPPTDKEGKMAYHLAKMAYDNRKAHHASDPASLPDSDSEMMKDDSNGKTDNPNSVDAFAPDQSAVELAQVMLPSDCVTGAGLVRGGVVMKLMDNASGVAVARHCGTNCVTVSVDAMDLVAPVLLGDVLRIRAKPIFASSKSIEIEVKVIAERFSLSSETGKYEREEIVSTKQAYFTFVSLGSTGKVLPMRPLALTSDEDKTLFEQGKKRYEQRKALRAGATTKQQ